MNIFGPTRRGLGNTDQKQRWLPSLIGAKRRLLRGHGADAGLNTARIKTSARREGDRYVLRGQRSGSPPPGRNHDANPGANRPARLAASR